jgi:hypothetical protein
MEEELMCQAPQGGASQFHGQSDSSATHSPGGIDAIDGDHDPAAPGIGNAPLGGMQGGGNPAVDAGAPFCGMYDGPPAHDAQESSVHDQQTHGLGDANAPLAGGLFQELRYPIAKNFPGPTPGTNSRFDLSFRDISGHSNPTSHAYLNRLTPQASGWKGLRLDHGPNVTTGGSTNWHWNQSGAKNAFGIADHTLASPAASRFGQVMKYAKPLGRVGMGLGIAMDGLSLGQNINESRKTGNWGNTVEDGSRIAGGWGGAWLGAKGGGALGATIGSFICPGIGTAIGGAVGGLAGGIGGYLGGSKLGKWLGSKL